jgi:hypothetical protein
MILWCSQGGDHPENNLTKSGYLLDMKVKKKPEYFFILGNLLELIIEIWRIRAIFFMKIVEIIFFRLKFGEKSPLKNNSGK